MRITAYFFPIHLISLEVVRKSEHKISKETEKKRKKWSMMPMQRSHVKAKLLYNI